MKIVCHKVFQLAPFSLGIYFVYQLCVNNVTLLIFPRLNFQMILKPYLGDPKDLSSEMHLGLVDLKYQTHPSFLLSMHE